VAKDFHNVPKHRPATDLDHRLGTELGLFTHSRAETARQEHGFHDDSSNLDAIVPGWVAAVVVGAAAELAALIVEPIPCKSAAAVDTLSGKMATKGDIGRLLTGRFLVRPPRTLLALEQTDGADPASYGGSKPDLSVFIHLPIIFYAREQQLLVCPNWAAGNDVGRANVDSEGRPSHARPAAKAPHAPHIVNAEQVMLDPQ
jgi:hypothetical protein